MAIPLVIALGICLCCVYFNYTGWIGLSRVLFQVMVICTITTYHLIIPELGAIYFFAPFVAITFSIFQVYERKKFIPLLLMALGIIFFFNFSNYQLFTDHVYPDLLMEYGAAFSLTLAILATGIVLYQLVMEDYHSKQELEEESQNFHSIIENTSDAIWLIKPDYTLVTFNKAYEGWSEKARGFKPYPGLDVIDTLNHAPSAQKELKSFFDMIVKTKEGAKLERYYEMGDLHFYVELSLNPIIEGEKVNAVSCFAKDITERKQIQNRLAEEKEKAEEASEAKSWFLSNMSHELRTPLNAISGVAQLMEKKKTDEGDLENLKIIGQATDQLLVLVNDILDISKIEAGKLKVQKASFQLTEIKEVVHNLFNHKASQKGVKLLVDIDENLPDTLYGDRSRLVQVLNNLVNNALKFTDEGHVKVSLEKKEESAEEILLQGSVEDTGIGIPEEAQAKLFEDFKQVEASTTRNYEGSGLGLSISKKLTELLGGQIYLESHKGVGSTFFFEIPFEPVQTNIEVENAKSEDADQNVPLSELDNPKILLVDDNELNIKVGNQVLKKLNTVPTHATGGKEALELVKKEKFDLILLDIHMPEMDGFEVTKQIRELQNGTTPNTVRIVIMSADVLKSTKEKAQTYNIDDFIEKPINLSEVEQTLKNLL